MNPFFAMLTAYPVDRLEFIVLFVPSLIVGALTDSFVEMLLEPMCPLIMNHARHVLPPRMLSGCIGWIAEFGQAGSALLPFFTSLLASNVALKVFRPLCAFPVHPRPSLVSDCV